ncbi:MAG: hypothetical protein Q7U57_15955 [Methylovulum sp.]|nr:hypothetical protein [Methylovulum sp.]
MSGSHLQASGFAGGILTATSPNLPNMHNYSDNWRHLKSILDGYATRNQSPEYYSYTDHIHAKALSIFLANATLATPKLDRKTVESVLAGNLSWPHTSVSGQFSKVDVPLTFLEEYGLVSFHADWCTVHCQTPRNPDNVDQSLIQLIQAIGHLKDIRFGQNGYIQPHYTCPADELERLLAALFGRASVAELLPALCLEDGHFKLLPGNKNFSPLVCTNLWLKLRETLEPKEAFESWILCLRVNCDWAMPVLFDDFDHEQRTEFIEQLLAYFAQDVVLSRPIDTLWRQSINENQFSDIVTPVNIHLSLTICAEGNGHSEDQGIIELEKPTLVTLSKAYPLPEIDTSSDLRLVLQLQRFAHWGEPDSFYALLLASTIEASIHINGQALTSWDFVEDVLALATSRPILKYLLFNVVPRYESASYMIWLLSRPATCDIALFYLAQRSFASLRKESHAFTLHFDKGYQQLVCHEYLRTIEKEPDGGDRLLKAVEFLGERCDLHSSTFSKSFKYQFLLCLLDSLSHQRIIQIGQVFAQHTSETEKTPGYQPPQHYWYLIGFWLIERIENTGIDSTGTLSRSLRETLLRDYKAEFEANMTGLSSGLEPNNFFSALPWHKLVEYEGISPLLALSSNCCDWRQNLSYKNKNTSTVALAVRNYLQILMCVGRSLRIPKDRERIAHRVVEIVRTLGFGPREQAIHLFDEAFYGNKYDLWTPFCSYTNLFQETLYDDFVERCLPLIPLNQLFVLLERCTAIARTQKLQEAIVARQTLETEDLGLSALEKAFISAWDTGHMALATKLMASAKDFLSQEPFATTSNSLIVRDRKVWMSYEYKLQLWELLETLKHDPQKFANDARQIPIPYEPDGRLYQEEGRALRKECDHFRRYISAAAYLESDPERCVIIMEALYKENKSSNFSFMLFKGRMALYEIKQDAMGLRHALSQFISSLADTEPEYMPTNWVASILDTYRQLQDSPGINEFWVRLNPDQQTRLEIMYPYCRALIASGEPLIAQQIINRYYDLNNQISEGLGIDDLIDELGKALPNVLSMSQLVQIVTEGSQRSVEQLAKHYSQIVSKEFEEYVSIVAPKLLPHEFLKKIVLEVAQELLLRKKNLQLHSKDSSGKTKSRISEEDLINDWFTSLFDKRMAEAHIGFRDQKRGGQSASGENPGEIDGYITDAKNKRIAIFEAFRLFSIDNTVISKHLNKIAGYDNESLSPVIIVAYCDVSDFAGLVHGYSKFIDQKEYTGFTVDTEKGGIAEDKPECTDQLWLGSELRRRNQREIVFYHLLLNMRFQEESTL